jgi:hypothetical protein
MSEKSARWLDRKLHFLCVVESNIRSGLFRNILQHVSSHQILGILLPIAQNSLTYSVFDWIHK